MQGMKAIRPRTAINDKRNMRRLNIPSCEPECSITFQCSPASPFPALIISANANFVPKACFVGLTYSDSVGVSHGAVLSRGGQGRAARSTPHRPAYFMPFLSKRKAI
jgi:hypothetical protein